MSDKKEIRTIEIVLTIDVDADQIDALPELDGVALPFFATDHPVTGEFDLRTRCVDACIRSAFRVIQTAGITAVLDDAVSKLGERRIPVDPFDAFY